MRDIADRAWVWYAFLILAVALLGGVGYLGFVVYPDLGQASGVGAGLLVLAAGAGVASLFAPCSFPLLLALLGRQEQRGGRASLVAFSLALAIGAGTLLVGLGVVVAVAGTTVLSGVTFGSTVGRTIRIAAGSALIVLGILQADLIAARPFAPVERAAKALLPRGPIVGERRPLVGAAAFGFFYLLAGFG